MSALFKLTGGEDFPDRLKCLISGPPKSGKTTLLGTVPNIVIADTEPHANNLQSVAHLNLPYVTVNSTSELQRLAFVLGDDTMRAKAASQLHMPAIEAVSIDTVDTLQQIMKKERLRETRKTEFLRDDWGWLKDELTAILRAFTALPLHVFFVVHTKTTELGKGDDARMIVLPSLQGGIAEEIAGMVGYSLLSFRKQEVRPDGSPYTKYWLRAEGDETYQFLGNRAAGKLPDVIEPSFQAIYNAAMLGRKAVASPVQPVDEPFSAQITASLIEGKTAASPAEEVTQNPGQQQGLTPPPAARPEDQAGQPPAPVPPVALADNDEPVNGVALSHTKKVYDAVGLEFPEDTIKGLTLGDARRMVKMWKAIQADDVEGKNVTGKSPAEQMHEYLAGFGWITQADKNKLTAGTVPEQPVAPAAVPDPSGTIEQVLAYIGDDLTRVQEVYELESARQKPRATLLNALVNKGAKVPTAVQIEPVQQPEPLAEAVVTPAPAATDDVSTEVSTDSTEVNTAAVALVEEQLGGVQISEDGQAVEPCQECQSPIDDEDIAVLSRSRFGRWLCVADYIAETKKPRVNA